MEPNQTDTSLLWYKPNNTIPRNPILATTFHIELDKFDPLAKKWKKIGLGKLTFDYNQVNLKSNYVMFLDNRIDINPVVDISLNSDDLKLFEKNSTTLALIVFKSTIEGEIREDYTFTFEKVEECTLFMSRSLVVLGKINDERANKIMTIVEGTSVPQTSADRGTASVPEDPPEVVVPVPTETTCFSCCIY